MARNGETSIVIEDVGLGMSVSRFGGSSCKVDAADWDIHTTMAMPMHCTKAENSSKPLTICHPAALRCTPPAMITTKETSVHSSMTTSNEMKKPTVLHILQKVSSVRHCSLLGKATYSGSVGMLE